MKIIGSIIAVFLTGVFFFMIYRLVISFLTKDKEEDEGDQKKETGGGTKGAN